MRGKADIGEGGERHEKSTTASMQGILLVSISPDDEGDEDDDKKEADVELAALSIDVKGGEPDVLAADDTSGEALVVVAALEETS